MSTSGGATKEQQCARTSEPGGEAVGEVSDVTTGAGSRISAGSSRIRRQATHKIGVLTLKQLALRSCIRNSHLVTDVGDLPYDLVEPILRTLTARQLVVIEKNSPQIRDNSEPLWKGLLRKDFSNSEIQDKDFRKQYGKLQKEKEKGLQLAKERLRENMARIEQEKEMKKTIQLDSDPIVERQKAKQRLKGSKSGSRYLQQTMNALKAKGSLFSSKNNVRFAQINTAPPPPPPPAPTPPKHQQQQKQEQREAQVPKPKPVAPSGAKGTTMSPIRKRQEPSIFLKRPRR